MSLVVFPYSLVAFDAMKMIKSSALLLAVLSVAAILISACGSSDPVSPTAPTPVATPTPSPTPSPTPPASPAATRIIGLSGNLALGSVTVGTSASTTLTISNTGNSTMTWSGLSTGNAVFTASATSGTVAAGGSVTVTLTFTPATATNYSSTLTVTSDATGGSATAGISGAGLAASTRILELEGNASTGLAFGEVRVGRTDGRTLRIRNRGNGALTVSGITFSNSAFSAGSFQARTIDPGGNLDVDVSFTPTSIASYVGTVTVQSDKTSGTNTLTTTGEGVPARIVF